MAKSKKKFYVVWEGHERGIFTDWETCKAKVSGFPNAKYQSFPTLEEAEEMFMQGYKLKTSRTKKSKNKIDKSGINADSIAVDAACSGNPGLMEYRGVDYSTGKELFHIGPLEEGTNNVGEFLAIVHGLAYLQKLGFTGKTIYSDSKIAIGWIKGKVAKTKLVQTNRNKKIFELIRRAEYWLKTNSYSNPILKWETSSWGEIPADFGRK